MQELLIYADKEEFFQVMHNTIPSSPLPQFLTVYAQRTDFAGREARQPVHRTHSPLPGGLGTMVNNGT